MRAHPGALLSPNQLRYFIIHQFCVSKKAGGRKEGEGGREEGGRE